MKFNSVLDDLQTEHTKLEEHKRGFVFIGSVLLEYLNMKIEFACKLLKL